MPKRLQQFRRGVTAHPDQPHLGLELRQGRFEDRRHRLARITPGCPEINEQRHVTVLRMLVEARRVIERDRSALIAEAVPRPTPCAIAEPLARHDGQFAPP